MNRKNFLIELKTAPVIAILRRPKVDVQVCVKMLLESGIRFIEMTMDSEQAEDFLRSTKQMESDKVIFGAGTVTTLPLAKKAMFAGAKFLVSPNFNPEVVRFAREHDLPIASTVILVVIPDFFVKLLIQALAMDCSCYPREEFAQHHKLRSIAGGQSFGISK